MTGSSVSYYMHEVMRNQINKGTTIIKDIMDYFKACMLEEI